MINTKNITDSPLRCQRMLIRLFRYSPRAVYVPGKYMVVPDALSRGTFSVKYEFISEIDSCTAEMMKNINISDKQLD